MQSSDDVYNIFILPDYFSLFYYDVCINITVINERLTLIVVFHFQIHYQPQPPRLTPTATNTDRNQHRQQPTPTATVAVNNSLKQQDQREHLIVCRIYCEERTEG